MNFLKKMLRFLNPQKSTLLAERTFVFPVTRVLEYYDSCDDLWYVPQYKNCFNKWVALSLPLFSKEKADRIIDRFLKKKLNDKH
jgi:hypothetical protein